jgi:cell division transport system permease protein
MLNLLPRQVDVNLRPRRVDHLGLRTALADRLLPVLVAAMSFLAALAIAGTLATATLAAHWQGDTAAALTIQVPEPDAPDATASGNRLSGVLSALQTAPGVNNPSLMSADNVNALLTPWLGADVAQLALPIPAVITATWSGPGTPDSLAASLQKFAPGTLVATGQAWAARVAALTTSLQACAAAILIIVALVAAAVVAVATRSGLAQRREAIEIIHGLGALDADIADRFAARATFLAVTGGATGAVLALPILVWLAALAAPFAGPAPTSGFPSLPPALWITLPALPLIAAAIGWGTAQITVRGWLRNLA